MAEKSELELIQGTYTVTWQIFMSWFTWFSNISLIAIGWIVTSEHTQMVRWFAILMIFLTVVGLGAIIGVRLYSKVALQRARAVSGDKQPSLESIFPTAITHYAIYGTFGALSAMTVVWIAIALKIE